MTGDETALRPGFCRGGVFRALRKPECSRLAASLDKKLPVVRYHWKMQGQMPHLVPGGSEKLMVLGTEKQARGKAIAAGQTGNLRACALMTRPAPPRIYGNISG